MVSLSRHSYVYACQNCASLLGSKGQYITLVVVVVVVVVVVPKSW